MISRKIATAQANSEGYEDVKDWMMDRDLVSCAVCKKVGTHDELRMNPRDDKDQDFYCEDCEPGR